MICSGRDKIESSANLADAVNTAKRLDLDGLVVVGGDDSNTNAAVLAEHFISQGNPSISSVFSHVCITMPSEIDKQAQKYTAVHI